VSLIDRFLSVTKRLITMDDRMDQLEKRNAGLVQDLAALSASHARLSERVARIEGMIQGAAMASGRTGAPKLRDE
jgi:hypothetical protein